MAQAKFVEYICSYCGRRETRGVIAGRPYPGNCPRKPPNRDGSLKPHSWRISKKIY